VQSPEDVPAQPLAVFRAQTAVVSLLEELRPAGQGVDAGLHGLGRKLSRGRLDRKRLLFEIRKRPVELRARRVFPGDKTA